MAMSYLVEGKKKHIKVILHLKTIVFIKQAQGDS